MWFGLWVWTGVGSGKLRVFVDPVAETTFTEGSFYGFGLAPALACDNGAPMHADIKLGKNA